MEERTMSIEENKAVMRRILEEIYNKGNVSVADELVSPEYNYDHEGGLGRNRGVESYKQFASMVLKAFPDHHITLEDIIAEGDKVVIRCTVTGTHTGGDYMGIAPTGKQFKMSAIIISRIVDGQIVEQWENADLFTQLQQLGAIPPMGQRG